jgi:hypothetical protein
MHQFLHAVQGRIAGVVRRGGVVLVCHAVCDAAKGDARQRRKRKERNGQPARRRAWQIDFHSHSNRPDYRIADFEI